MVLQNIIFPFEFAKNHSELYFRCSKNSSINENNITFEPGGECVFNTYVNSFTVSKWVKYTNIDNLFLEINASGTFVVQIFNAEYCEDTKETKEDEIKKVEFIDGITIELPLTDKGIYYIKLSAITDGIFYGANWSTNSNKQKEISICGVICTYKREEFLKANLKEIESTITENENSPMYGKFEVIVSDNGASFKERKEGKIRIYRNENTGGAGGFTRGMIEMMKVREEKGYTHILLMDDDIRFETESILRTYSILAYLKNEYSDAFIGGAMFRTDKRNVQNERADRWDYKSGKVVPLGLMNNMYDINCVIRNEADDLINYLSWWYCAFPVSIVQEDNLPLPIFIKRDDIEYGLRNGKTFITLNGIFVWHEPFENKRPAFLEYYYNRNQCIMESVHNNEFTAKILKRRIEKEVIRQILTFRYNEARSTLKGVNDFLKGIDYLKSLNAKDLNEELMAFNAISKPMKAPTLGKYKKAKKWSKGKKLLALITFNGFLLPPKKRIAVPAVRPSYKAFFRARSVVNYDFFGKRGYITKRSLKNTFKLSIQLLKLNKNININFEKAKQSFHDRIGEITNLGFWNEYLGLTNSHKEEINATINMKDRKLIVIDKWSSLKRSFVLLGHKIVKLILRLLCIFIPLEKNKVTLIVTGRRGFACNPKYVALELKEKYGDKYKLTWVTGYPITCEEVLKNGIEVLMRDTFKYIMCQLRSKTVVYNDSIPSYMPKRKGQIYINTWHGAINYKHIGYDYLADQSKPALRKFAMRNPQPDYFVSGSGFFTEDTAKSFRFDESAFLSCGLPRNSLLFNEEKKEKAIRKVKDLYEIKDEKILIYAPTFRFGMASDTHGLDFDMVMEALSEKFGGEWIVFYRGHGFVVGKVKLKGKVIDVTRYPDMQELIASADGMISDYSSAMWDMSFTKKPIFVYAPDKERYTKKDRSFAYPPEKWPYPVAENNEELVDNIRDFNAKDFASKIEEHHRDARSFEEGKGAETLAQIIDESCFGGK